MREHVSVVAGVGINLHVPAGLERADTSGWAHGVAGLDSTIDELPGMHRLAAMVADAMFAGVRIFETHGLRPYTGEFERLHVLTGKTVVIDTPDGQVTGTVNGIDETGALLVDPGTGDERIVTGSIVQIRDDAVAV